ncbi:MAG: biopolymer transporter ExbD [Phycisphaerales bacterium]|nr:biopolymer transporter ExbD [Phycisphaerales bacterium]
MRSRHQTGGRRGALGPPKVELNLTPMIDVVFQLLIYFLLGTSFAVGEQTFRMDLPDRSGPSEVDPFELDDAPVVVEVLGEGRVRIAGPWKGPDRTIDLADFLERQRLDRGGLLPSDTPIHIDPRPGVDWGEAVEAFNAAVRAGYQSVGFADTTNRSGSRP